MSLVTTAMSILSRRAWHRARVRAVLPEPTGPPIPTRRACLLMFLRSEETRILGFVAGAGDGEARCEIRPCRLGEATGCGHCRRNAAAEVGEQPLAGRLTKRHGLEGRHHLVLGP